MANPSRVLVYQRFAAIFRTHFSNSLPRPKYWRTLRLEGLERREQMCSDMTLGLDGSPLTASGLIAGGSQLEGEADPQAAIGSDYLADYRVPENMDDDVHWVMKLDADALAEVMSLVTPAVLGVFMPQSLSYTTLVNGMPILHSLPGSPTSVFLDFDGDATTSTEPYDVDGDDTTFNATEQRTIAEAWRQLSTYFAMYDTDVTTIQPASTQPKAWAAVGNNIVGGYSAVNVFPNDRPRSFNQSSDARSRVSGIAHEVGHNFGLSHQSDFDAYGVEIRDYSSGYDEYHVPIMGVDFAQRFRKWYIGHTANASSLQDDVNIITTDIKAYQPAGGDGFRADDYGGTIATATALTTMSNVQYASGIIERLNDVDAFSFASNGQPLLVGALEDFPSGVDLKLEVYDASGILIAAKDGPENFQTIPLTLPLGTYYALVSSHGNYGDLGTYNLTVRSLPANWSSRDIGTVGITGFSQFDPSTNTFVIAGSGADIAGTADEMQFAMQTLTGDGTIIARVASITNTNANAKAGIEIRETVANNARHVALAATPNNGLRFLRRSGIGGSTTTTSTAAAAFSPVWLRLERVGNTFTASQSPDGVNWTTIGAPATVSMNASVQIGLVVTAGNDRMFNAAEFDNVSVTGNLGVTPPTPNALPAPTGVNVLRGTGSDLIIGWSDQAGETGYRIERSIDGRTFTTVGTTGANATTFTNTNLLGTMRYFYRVLALDGSGASIPSSVVSQINRPSAVTNLEVTSLDQSRIVLDWIETSGETGYRIERSPDGVAYTTIGTVSANVPSYTSTGLASGTSYFYRVTPTSSIGDGVPAIIGGATRLPQVPGLVFTTKTSSQIGLSWTDIASEANYRIQRSTDGTNYTNLIDIAADSTSYLDSTVQPTTEYYYRVVGVNGESISLYNGIFTASPAANPLPSPWSSTDIGTNAGDGSTQFATGVFKIISSGSSIGGTADNFRYTSQLLDGDGTITARVASLEDTATNARLGVMIRESLAGNSRHVMVSARPGDPLQFLSRSATAGSTTTTADITDSAPVWLRLTRVGNVFTGFRSADGSAWTQIGQVIMTMPTTVYIGMAATAASTTELNTSTADNVTLTGDLRTASITNRRLFYNRSTSTVFGDGSGNPTNAIDTTKVALLPGGTPSFSNYSNYLHGLNGLIVDVTGLDTATAADFQFATWDGIAAAGFVATPAVPAISVLSGGGVGGSHRIKIEFANSAIKNTWLRVTVLANARTDLAANDVFYFGNAIADMGMGNVGTPTIVRVNATDTAAVRQNQSVTLNSVPVTNIYDVNKDGRVNATDTSIVRQNQATQALTYFTPSVAPSASDFSPSDAAATLAPPILAVSAEEDEPDPALVDAFFEGFAPTT